jgi:alpha-D-ribose 1-methylphosphonate 5-triphosphate diphosphatase
MNTTDYLVHDVCAVLPDQVVDDATIVVRDGLIVAIETGPRRRESSSIDGRGALCLPGLIDTHSDGLEKELRPRPGVVLDDDFAVCSFEGRVRAAGVTTMFHGIGFEEDDRHQRTVELAHRLCAALEQRASHPHALVDHRILYRLDARDADGFRALVDRLTHRHDDGALPLVSFEDHTPGQGQYTDRRAFERYIQGTRGLSEAESMAVVDALITERDELIVNRAVALEWLTQQARDGAIRLMAHDPTTADDVRDAIEWHASIAEFPTTLDAARRARDAGLRIVCGAPNVVRGRSHSGNVSARELIAGGLCDGLASDYLPTTMLGAVAALVDAGDCSLPRAVGLVTSGPADTVGLTDRGRLEPGLRADLVLVHLQGTLPNIRAVLRAERASAATSV